MANATPSSSNGASTVPPNIGAFSSATDAQAVIVAQLNLIAAQWTQATDLTDQLPTTAPPPGADLQSITDALAGASRALGAYVSQINTLYVLWPPTS